MEYRQERRRCRLFIVDLNSMPWRSHTSVFLIPGCLTPAPTRAPTRRPTRAPTTTRPTRAPVPFDDGTTVGAARAYGLPLCLDERNRLWCSNGCASKFYTVNGTGQTITASTCSGSPDWDTRLIVREGDSQCSDLRCVGTWISSVLSALEIWRSPRCRHAAGRSWL
jgi:hypothetical protein